jgi:hypothetical protein
MPSLGFEPTIPELEREKTFHALDHAVIVIGMENIKVLYSDQHDRLYILINFRDSLL